MITKYLFFTYVIGNKIGFVRKLWNYTLHGIGKVFLRVANYRLLVRSVDFTVVRT